MSPELERSCYAGFGIAAFRGARNLGTKLLSVLLLLGLEAELQRELSRAVSAHGVQLVLASAVISEKAVPSVWLAIPKLGKP